MPDPVRPVAPREDEWRAIVAKWERRADRGFNPEEDEATDAYWRGVRAVCAELLAVSPVPWAGSGSGAEEELTRGGTRDYSEVSSPPQPPNGDK